MRSEWEEGMCGLSGGRVCGLSRVWTKMREES